jgi:nucleoside-diphosphate-sugar epimerase
MHVFVTGSSGYIGSAVVAELLTAGHTVAGLARSDASAQAVAAAGAEVVRGDIDDVELLREAVAKTDGVVHLAYRHDLAFTGDPETALATDLTAIEALGEALAGTGRPLVIASGVSGLKPGALLTEHDAVDPTGMQGRIGNERAALALADRGVRAVSVRFAPTVHGPGDGGFLTMIVKADREAGVAAYVGDGGNRWPAVHRSDAARLVRLAVEGAPARSILHAVGEEGVPLREIAEAVGRGLSLPAASVTVEQAQAQFGFMAHFVALDMPASSAATRELLSWEPTGPSLIADIEAGHYFSTTSSDGR